MKNIFSQVGTVVLVALVVISLIGVTAGLTAENGTIKNSITNLISGLPGADDINNGGNNSGGNGSNSGGHGTVTSTKEISDNNGTNAFKFTLYSDGTGYLANTGNGEILMYSLETARLNDFENVTDLANKAESDEFAAEYTEKYNPADRDDEAEWVIKYPDNMKSLIVEEGIKKLPSTFLEMDKNIEKVTFPSTLESLPTNLCDSNINLKVVDLSKCENITSLPDDLLFCNGYYDKKNLTNGHYTWVGSIIDVFLPSNITKCSDSALDKLAENATIHCKSKTTADTIKKVYNTKYNIVID